MPPSLSLDIEVQIWQRGRNKQFYRLSDLETAICHYTELERALSEMLAAGWESEAMTDEQGIWIIMWVRVAPTPEE